MSISAKTYEFGEAVIQFVIELVKVVFLITQLLRGGLNKSPAGQLSSTVTPRPPPSISHDSGWDSDDWAR